LALEGIEHRATPVPTRRTNGFLDRMNYTLLDECLSVSGRTTNTSSRTTFSMA
jgi:hypothetical protein